MERNVEIGSVSWRAEYAYSDRSKVSSEARLDAGAMTPRTTTDLFGRPGINQLSKRPALLEEDR